MIENINFHWKRWRLQQLSREAERINQEINSLGIYLGQILAEKTMLETVLNRSRGGEKPDPGMGL